MAIGLDGRSLTEAVRIRARAAERLTGWRPRSWRLSPLTLRILGINVLALGIGVAGVLYLGRYQDNLIQSQLDALKAEARLISAFVADGGVVRGADERFMLVPRLYRGVVRNWVEVTRIRTRLFDSRGTMIADSNLIPLQGGVMIEAEPLPPPRSFQSMLDRWLSRLAQRLESWPGAASLPVYRDDQQGAPGSDLTGALKGNVEARVWLDANGHLLLTAAAPVQRFKLVLGATLLNRDGSTIEAAIRSTRLDIFKVFFAALAVTIVLSLYLAGVISRPLRRLATAAERLRMGSGRDEIPDFTRRRDEIGELSRALREMTAALWLRMDATERFAADVAHELKNPLSSLGSAIETLGRVTDPAQQRRLFGIVREDVTRLDRLISDISNASRLDAELSRAEAQPVELYTLLSTLAQIHQAQSENRPAQDGTETAPVEIALDVPSDLVVRGIESRLGQVFQNLISNAVSFSPPGGVVRVTASRQGSFAGVTVEDEGPGIPGGKLDAIFDRFYSERPAGEAFGTHSGLGLSIAKQIVETLGGAIRAENRTDSDGKVYGARFVVELPVA